MKKRIYILMAIVSMTLSGWGFVKVGNAAENNELEKMVIDYTGEYEDGYGNHISMIQVFDKVSYEWYQYGNCICEENELSINEDASVYGRHWNFWFDESGNLKAHSGVGAIENAHTFLRVEEETDQGYSMVVSQTIEDTHSFNWSNGYGALFDIDGNGTDELIMIYTSEIQTDEAYTYPAKVCSVYTMSEGEPLQLVNEAILFPEAGGASGYAAIIQDNGNDNFAIKSEVVEAQGDGFYKNGSWKLFSIEETNLALNDEVTYTFYSEDGDLYEMSTVVMNGIECSYEEYKLWESNLEETVRLEPIDNGNMMLLEDLLKCLY